MSGNYQSEPQVEQIHAFTCQGRTNITDVDDALVYTDFQFLKQTTRLIMV